VSGAIGEETAVEAMRAGAHDYVLKDNLTRLPAAVIREIREAQIRQERRQAIESLRDLARRSAFLAEASSSLALSLDQNETLACAASSPIPEAADWCMVTVREGPRAFVSALAHVDGDRAAEARARLPARSGEPSAAAARVLRSGEVQWTSPDTVLPPGHLALDVLGYQEGVCLPLVARRHTLGAITLVRAGAPFPERDLGFAEELAARAAMALDNAALYHQARQAIRARDEFLSVAAHELNTPLGTLALQLDEGSLRLGGRDDPALAIVRRQVERLSRLVSNLLDVSRLTDGPIELWRSEVDLAATTREVLAQFAAELSRAGCASELRAVRPVVGRWDPLRIEQVVANLISNACKYGGGKPIEVAVESEGQRARLSVRDHGLGIAAGQRDRIFERFERAPARGPSDGLGLGLYITRQVVEAHGGKIAVTSEPGTGSTFSVELPLEPAPGARS
jgi:signal transduction histidine kinase